jgi:hypothetical protein
VEGAYQFGSFQATPGTSTDRSAWAAAGHVARTFDLVVLTPTFGVGAAYASGDSGAPGTYRQFDPLLADVHAFHGAMDVFAWSNLIEGSASASVVPWNDTRATLEYRYARLAEASGEWISAYLSSIGRAPGSSSAELGHELDAVFAYRPWPVLELIGGYSALLLGDGARSILAAEARGQASADGTYSPAAVAHLGYVQATLNFP